MESVIANLFVHVEVRTPRRDSTRGVSVVEIKLKRWFF